MCPTCGVVASRESLRKSLPDAPDSESDEESGVVRSDARFHSLRKALPVAPPSDDENDLGASQEGFMLNRLDPSRLKKEMVDKYGHVELQGRAEEEISDEDAPLPPPKPNRMSSIR